MARFEILATLDAIVGNDNCESAPTVVTGLGIALS
jgi:hypothetical protein